MHTHSRRGFLSRIAGSFWAGATLMEQSVLRAAQARAQAKESYALPPVFDIEKVADGVYATIARAEAVLNSNGAIFETSSGILIVDTHSKPSAMVSLVAQIRREITTKPVRWIVNTHFHWDHTQGTPSLRRIAPRADIVASEATRDLLASAGADRLKASIEEVRRSAEDFRKRLAEAKTAEERAFYRKMVADIGGYISEMQNYAPELPNLTFERDLILHDKELDLHLAFRGRGHTAGDIVVWCPQKKVLATGDLLHGFEPYFADSYPLEWQRTLLYLAEFEFEHVMGGHGPVQHTRDRLYQMGTYIEELTAAVLRGKRAGRTVAQLQAEISPANLRSLEDGGYGRFVAGCLLKYKAQPPGSSAAAVLAAAVAENVAHAYSALDRS